MNPNLKKPEYLRKGSVIRDLSKPEGEQDKDYKTISAAKKVSRQIQGDKQGDGTLRVVR